jgi:hypothetical protein
MKTLRTVLKSSLLTAITGAALFSVSAAPSRAQLPLIPKIRLKAGIFIPQDSTLSNGVGNTWLKIGADVSLPVGLNLPIVGASTRLGIDYAVKGSSNIIPITLMEVIQPSVAIHSPVYGGAGIGLWTAHIKGAGSSSKLGFRLMGGIEFSEKFFGEVQYDIVGKIGGVRADGFSILVGTKF